MVRRDRPPTDELQTFLFYDSFKHPLALLPFRRVLRHEHEAGAILAGLGKLETELLALLLEEGMRHLHQDARSVARIGLATARAAMVQVAENLEGVLDDLMGLFSFDVHHEADATGFMFKPGIVQALLGRQPVCLRA